MSHSSRATIFKYQIQGLDSYNSHTRVIALVCEVNTFAPFLGRTSNRFTSWHDFLSLSIQWCKCTTKEQNHIQAAILVGAFDSYIYIMNVAACSLDRIDASDRRRHVQTTCQWRPGQSPTLEKFKTVEQINTLLQNGIEDTRAAKLANTYLSVNVLVGNAIFCATFASPRFLGPN